MTKDEAIQQAINLLDNTYKAHAVRKALQEALAQPAQEPVAWMDKSRYFLELDLEDLCVMASCKKHEAVPLYTHPAPAKEWVGLSEDEIEYWECLKAPPVHPDFVDDDSWRNFAKAIEQVLKEKNHG